MLYTDGLIERPGEPIDDSLARLCQVVTAQPPETACAAVMAALVGSESARDDIALLIFRRQPPDRLQRSPRSANALSALSGSRLPGATTASANSKRIPSRADQRPGR